jgi:hypothetical protein
MAELSEQAVDQSEPGPAHDDKSETVKRDSDVTGTCTSTQEETGNDDEDEMPYPGFVPVALRCLDQKNVVRLWCLRTITWPYPFLILFACTCISIDLKIFRNM